MKRVTPLIPLIALASAACQTPERNDAQVMNDTPKPAATAARSPAITPKQEVPAQQARPDNNPADAPDVKVQKLGECSAAPQMKQWATRARDVADANGDGVVSKTEASGALNFLVGGLFFRADANADGKLSAQERKQARKDLVEQYPDLGGALTSLATNERFSNLLSAVDERVPETVELAKVRAGANEAVEHVFATMDLNSDNEISRVEVDEGINLAFAAAGRFAFSRADGNSDKRLTKEEFTGALKTPLERAFDAADVNKNGSLSEAEAASMMAWVSERIDVVGERGYDVVSGLINKNAQGN
jgi:Ca2+-binding EF-hand superfamily protein